MSELKSSMAKHLSGHHNIKQTKHKSHKNRAVYFSALIVVLVLAGTLYWALMQKTDNTTGASSSVIVQQNLPAETPKTGKLKQFSGAEFRDLYNNFAYPNTDYIADDTIITGDAVTDSHIQKIAEDRGYVRRSAPIQNTFVEVQPGMILQERASQPWKDLKTKASEDGIHINLTAAYRSAVDQRTIFLDRLKAIGLTPSLISSGKYDDKIIEVLATTAIPGYSRHHTGYTIDIGCEDQPGAAFENTDCFTWLSKDNYKNAKSFGWIPSYPEGAGEQGPEPETWEYVWVGKDAVTE